MDKTNVMRLLDSKEIPYQAIYYDKTLVDGMKIAQELHENPEKVFKTLLTIGSDGMHYVFCIPVCFKLDLKKAAQACKVKAIEMVLQKELLPLSGYIHGGCSPLLMKKSYPTYIDETALLYDQIYLSGGKVGCQIKIALDDLKKVLDYSLVDLLNLDL